MPYRKNMGSKEGWARVIGGAGRKPLEDPR